MTEQEIKELIRASIEVGRRTMAWDLGNEGVLEPGNGWDDEYLENFYPVAEQEVDEVYKSLISGGGGRVTVTGWGVDTGLGYKESFRTRTHYDVAIL